MAAFAEMGVHPDLISAIEKQGWLLPTPIQTECIPLILGGGDVMGAAETGSGKTGAFALPVLQIVHENLEKGPEQSSQQKTAKPKEECKLSIEDRDSVVAIAADGLQCQSRDEVKWGGVRCTNGIHRGKVYFEARVADEGLCRVGWSLGTCSLDLGTQPGSFGYGGTGKKSTKRQFDNYGGPYGQNDVIGCSLDLDGGLMAFSRNGQDLGIAFSLGNSLQEQPLFPAVCLKNAELVLNFGQQPFLHRPAGFKGIAEMPAAALSSGAAMERTAAPDHKGSRTPIALILEPSKDLAEQTARVIAELQVNLASPSVRSMVAIGGEPIAKQARQLSEGMDIITGTPGRLMDLIDGGKLSTAAIKFFVLDEADRLLDTGNLDTILKMFASFPKGQGATRLQVLMFSATLHSEEVKSAAAKICQNPILTDLKGKEAIPESVDHVQIRIDPREDRSWLQDSPEVHTDNAHAFDTTGPQLRSRENWSLGVKRLKPRILQRVIDLYKMDQCLIFCRTNFDCDNMEAFLNGIGGGRAYRGKTEKGRENPYSCLVLAGQRSIEQRREALQAFKDGDIRFLICTDVAARGIDITGLPYLINVTLPDRSEDYIHRVGRVGRADRLGLAISLVSQVEEKVWYCRAKGYKPWLKPRAQDVTTHEEGGHTIWYNELQLLKDIEERLKQPIQAVAEDLSLPKAIQTRLQSDRPGGRASYGEERSSNRSKEVTEHQEVLRPAVAILADLERQAQRTFFDLKRFGASASPV